MFTLSQRRQHSQLEKMANHILEHGIQQAHSRPEAGDGMFRVTQDWIRANATPAGGYKNEQVRLLGLRYPLKHGWTKQCEGRMITNEDRLKFESFHAGYKATKKSTAVMAHVVRQTDVSTVAHCGCDVLPWDDCEHTVDDSEAMAMLKAHC